MKTYRAVYYNIVDTLEYENCLLKKWGINNLELIDVKNKSGKVPFTECAAGADAIVVEYEPITREVVEKLKCCKIIALQSIGYDNIDIKAAAEHGICVTNAPRFCTEDVALHSIGMMLDLARGITYFDRRVRAGCWEYELAPPIHRIHGETVGLVFFGSIPRAMVPVLKNLGMRVLVYAPTKAAEFINSYGAEKADTLAELLMQSDFVSLHMPLKKETFHMIGEKELKQMKKTAYLINTARGAVVDEKALAAALKDGTIAGAAADVFEDEKGRHTELASFCNTVVTPHTAFLSEESFYDARKIALCQIVERLVQHRKPENLVNRELLGEMK